MAETRGPGGVDADTHITVLSVLTIAGGGLVLLLGGVAAWGVWFGLGYGLAGVGPWAFFGAEAARSIVSLMLVVALAAALPAIAGGIGLAMRREWGRVLTLVAATGAGLAALVSMTLVPLVYTAYAFWALTREEVAAVFKRPAEPEDLGDATA